MCVCVSILICSLVKTVNFVTAALLRKAKEKQVAVSKGALSLLKELPLELILEVSFPAQIQTVRVQSSADGKKIHILQKDI